MTRIASAGSAHGADAAHAAARVLAVALVAVLVAHLSVQLATPGDGAHATPGLRGFTAEGLAVDPVRAGGALEAGDVVVAVDGVAVEALLARALGAPGAAPAGTPDWRHGRTATYEVLRSGARVRVPVELAAYPLVETVARAWGTVLFALVHASLAALLILRRPGLTAVRVLATNAAALLAATTWSLGLGVADVVSGTGFWLYHLGSTFGFMLFWTTGLHFALVFPRPLAPARRGALVACLHLVPIAVLLATAAASRSGAPSLAGWVASWSDVVDLHAATLLGLTLLALGWQAATVRSTAERAQIRWVVYGAALAGGAGLGLYLLPPLLGGGAVHANTIGAVVIVFPVAIAFAVLRHALFDVDRLIGQTVVYGGLTLAVSLVYVLVVGVLGSRLRADDLTLGLLATGLVAVGFQPVREVLQRAVDRWTFGDRDDPVAALERLGTRLQATADVDRLLPTLVETVAHALRLPYVALVVGAGPEPAASYGRPQPHDLELPLHDGDETIGRLLVAPREQATPLGPRDRRVLGAVARQAGAAVRRVELARDLQRSREALVRAREEERRRLRRDLHDGLGPSLAALALKVDAARNLVGRDPERAEPLLASLGGDVQSAVREVRRVVEALRPPALDDLGLVGALEERARSLSAPGIAIGIEAPGDLVSMPAAVEVAAYFIALEAMTNAVRHGAATSCRVALRPTRTALTVEVRDDGRGVPEGRRGGVGLHSMRERAEELGGRWRLERPEGGGTRVVAHLPLPEAHP